MLSTAEIATQLEPYRLDTSPDWSDLLPRLSSYLDLLIRWNLRTNLSAIRAPEEIVRRHFGESLFAAQHIGPTNSVLDIGSGAGFPGLPIQLLHPDLPVTLAESQGKKAAFLREAIRTLHLPTQVWPHRAETLPAGQTFETVTLRAVDDMSSAVAEAVRRARSRILILTTRSAGEYPALSSFSCDSIPIPESKQGILLIAQRK